MGSSRLNEVEDDCLAGAVRCPSCRCSHRMRSGFLSRQSPAPETVQQAKTNFDNLRHGQFTRIEASLDPRISKADADAGLAKMKSLIPAGAPLSVRTVGTFVQCDTRTGCDKRATLEYRFPQEWLMVQLIVHTQNGSSVITSFTVVQESKSLEAADRFTLKGKTVIQYMVVATAILFLAFMIWVLVLCIRTPMRRRKWLWIVLILLGLGKYGVNWSSGNTFHRILWINILPCSFGTQFQGTWFVYFSLPLGAIIFLLLRNRLRKPASPPPSLESHPSEIATT